MKYDYHAQKQQWRGHHRLMIKKTKREDLKNNTEVNTWDACFTFFLFKLSMVCIVFLPQLHWCYKSTFVNILLISQVHILEFDWDNMEDIDSRWQRGCQRSPLESPKWQLCSAHQSVLEWGNNQSHATKKLHTSQQGRVRPFWTFILQLFPKPWRDLLYPTD